MFLEISYMYTKNEKTCNECNSSIFYKTFRYHIPLPHPLCLSLTLTHTIILVISIMINILKDDYSEKEMIDS